MPSQILRWSTQSAFAVDVVESLAKVLNEEGFAPRMLPFAAEAADDDFDDIEAR